MVSDVIYLSMTPNVHVQPGPHLWFLTRTSSVPAGYMHPDVHSALQLNKIHDSTDPTCQEDIKLAPPIVFLFSVIDHPKFLIVQAKHLTVILDSFLFHSATTPSANPVGLTTTMSIIDPIWTPIQAIIFSHIDYCYFLLNTSLCFLPPSSAGFVLHCCITNYYSRRSFKQHHFIIYDICLLLIMKTTTYFLSRWVRSPGPG